MLFLSVKVRADLDEQGRSFAGASYVDGRLTYFRTTCRCCPARLDRDQGDEFVRQLTSVFREVAETGEQPVGTRIPAGCTVVTGRQADFERHEQMAMAEEYDRVCGDSAARATRGGIIAASREVHMATATTAVGGTRNDDIGDRGGGDGGRGGGGGDGGRGGGGTAAGGGTANGGGRGRGGGGTGGGDIDIATLLLQARLEVYQPYFEREGFEFASDIPVDNPDELNRIETAAGIRDGHRTRWRRFVDLARAAATQ